MSHAANGKVIPLGDHPRARSRLSAQESASVLTGCRELALGRMGRALAGMLDRVEDELFALAEKATQRDAQNLYLDARSQAREKRALIEATFREHFADFFNRKVRGDAQKSVRGDGELALVNEDELEESLAVDEMSRKLRAACEGELFALSQRFGFLLERPDLADEGNPVSPSTVCAALRDACDRIESRLEVRLALLHQLERHAEEELMRLYRELNAHLVERQILPEVRAVVRKAASTAPAARDDAAMKTPAVAAMPTPAAGAPDLFGTLAQLVAAQNATAAGGGGNSTGAPLRPLVAELSSLQAVAVPPRDAGAGDFTNVLRALKEAPRATPLESLDAATIDIVALLFDYVFEDRHIPASVKALLGRLQIPTLKVALIDKAFFSTQSHPARRLIDVLAAASIGLDESNAHGSATLALVEEAVESVRENFQTDLGVFDGLVVRVESFMEEARRAEQAVVERSAKMVEVRERQEAARIAAEEEVHRRLHARAVPPAVRVMLETQWARVLGEELRESERGQGWKKLTQTMDDLLWSVEPKSAADDRKRLVAMLPGLIRDLQQGLERAGMAPQEREAFLGALVDCHAIAVKAGMRGVQPLPEPVAEAVPEPPRIEREVVKSAGMHFEEIRLKGARAADGNLFTRTGVWTNLQRGTWVEFAQAEGGAMRARLTWISPNKAVYLFTNPLSGAVAVSISPDALAEQMRRGEARMLDDAPLVERAVDSVIASLRQANPPRTTAQG